MQEGSSAICYLSPMMIFLFLTFELVKRETLAHCKNYCCPCSVRFGQDWIGAVASERLRFRLFL